mgnify:CR=1 FL=1
MLRELMPMPRTLRDAIARGDVVVDQAHDGQPAFTLSRDAENVDEIGEAIDRYRRWRQSTDALVGALIALALTIAAAILLFLQRTSAS